MDTFEFKMVLKLCRSRKKKNNKPKPDVGTSLQDRAYEIARAS